MKVLLTGWFSFEQMGASAGDLMARDVAAAWMEEAGAAYEIAHASPFEGGVRLDEIDPSVYTHLVFVCGPFGNGPPITDLLRRFSHCKLIGLNLSMLEPLEVWNPFSLLLERDSSRIARPDMSLLSLRPLVPVVGLVLIDDQPEYGERDLRKEANEAFGRLLAGRETAVVKIDTRMDENATGLRTPQEVESLIARMDVVLTTRLHGLVLALKNGVPVIAIDSVAGGHKVSRQAGTLGWKSAFLAEALVDEELDEAFSFCLSIEGRKLARECSRSAKKSLEQTGDEFIRALRTRTV